MALVSVGPLVAVGAFFSGKFLRQRRTAEATLLTLSDEGILAIVEPGKIARCLMGVRSISFHHGKAVSGMYGAEIPASLSSSAAYGAVVNDTDAGRDVLVYTG